MIRYVKLKYIQFVMCQDIICSASDSSRYDRLDICQDKICYV